MGQAGRKTTRGFLAPHTGSDSAAGLPGLYERNRGALDQLFTANQLAESFRRQAREDSCGDPIIGSLGSLSSEDKTP